MVTITPKAKEELVKLLESEKAKIIRVSYIGTG